jgi:hypothetical protein
MLEVENSLFQINEVVMLQPSHLLHLSWPDWRDIALNSCR